MIKTLGTHASEVSLGATQNALFLGLGAVSELSAVSELGVVGERGVVAEAEDSRPNSSVQIGQGALRCVTGGSTLTAKSTDTAATDSGVSNNPAVAAHVLVCDDETRLGDLTAGLLEECGFAAGFVPSAVDAMAYLEAHEETRVLLLDVNLSGGKSAQDLLAFLVGRSSSLRVVLTSGSAKQEVRVELTQHPLVVGYLEKPYAEEELTAAIMSALSGD